MKTLFLTLTFILGTSWAQAQEIKDWEPTLPISQEDLLETVQQRAYEHFFYEGKNASCGGEIEEPVLSDYFTFMGYRGELTHNVKLSMFVTGAYNECEKLTISQCDLPMTIKDRQLVHIGKWHCTVVEIE